MPEEVPQVSFNALNGANSFQTTRITGKIRKHEVHILIDRGATNNFLYVNVAKQVGCKTNKTYQLEVETGGGRKLISNVVYKEFEGTTNAELLMFCVYPNTGVNLMKMEGQAKIGEIFPELSKVVDTFVDVFEMPTELPPKTSHDHKIPLLPNTQPTNIRPYRHPHMQKDAIEVMDKFPIPIIEELIEELYGATVFSKLDLSKSLEDHVQHSSAVLATMRHNQLFAKKSKCVFGTSQVEYLRHVISAKEVATNPNKIKAMQDWLKPSNVKQLRGFLGLTGYYRRFIMNFALVSKPLTQLLKKGGYNWTKEAQLAFETLKTAMLRAPVLALPDFTKPFEVETNALGLGGYLLDRHFIIKTDDFSLKYLLDHKITTPTQMKWLPKLIGFDYEVSYKKGSENGATDAVSRVQTSDLFSMITTLITTELAKKIEASWLEDEKLLAIIKKLQYGQEAKKHYVWSNNQLTRKGKIMAGQNPELRKELLQHYHRGFVRGH
nr:hypothetical protein [Tanacetum cinerariifolium]